MLHTLFNSEKKMVLSEPKKFTPPIVILDVDETLILGKNSENFAIDTFNDRLIHTLVQSGIKEVYLLTAFKLDILKTKAERDEIKPLLRLSLIKYLEEKGITTKAVVTNYDIAHCAAPLSNELKLAEDNWISKPFAGHHYNSVIKPFEEKVLDDPNIDLNENKDYQKSIQAQKDGSEIVNKITNFYETKSIKAPLADILFTCLKQEESLSGEEKRTVLFLDDKMHYIEAVSAVAKKHKIFIDCLKITDEPYQQNYNDFFQMHYPILEYQQLVLKFHAELEAIHNNIPQALPKSFLSKQSKYLGVIQKPISKLFEVFNNVEKDMVKNINRHDYIGACNAIIHELKKSENLLKEHPFPREEKNIADKIIKQLTQMIKGIKKIQLSLAIVSQDFNPKEKIMKSVVI
jgi:hypothetical protein